MIPRANFKEFTKEFQQRTGDTIDKLIMARIVETPAYVIKQLGLEFPPGQNQLWGLLIFGKKDIHFFVHIAESSFASMFRNATNGRPPREQYLHIPQEQIQVFKPVRKNQNLFSLSHFLPFCKPKPQVINLQFKIEITSPQTSSQKESLQTISLFFEPVGNLEELIPLLNKYLHSPAPNVN